MLENTYRNEMLMSVYIQYTELLDWNCFCTRGNTCSHLHNA